MRKTITVRAEAFEEKKEQDEVESLRKKRLCGMKRSTAARSRDGLSEKEIRALSQANEVPSSRVKKRSLRDLNLVERTDIIHSSLVEY